MAAPAKAAPAEARGVKSPAAMPASVTEAAAPDRKVQLYLLRHADAGDPAAWEGDDAARPLSDKGRRQAKRLARHLENIKLEPDAIVTSPKLRAAQTAKVVGQALGVGPTEDDRLAGPLDLATLGALLGSTDGARRIVLVGHDPDFSSLASSLSGAPIELSKGAIARIDLAESSLEAGSGALRWLIPPGALPR